jgi:hypothetical protein
MQTGGHKAARFIFASSLFFLLLARLGRRPLGRRRRRRRLSGPTRTLRRRWRRMRTGLRRRLHALLLRRRTGWWTWGWLHLPLLRRWRRRRWLHLRRCRTHDVWLLRRRTTLLTPWRATLRTTLRATWAKALAPLVPLRWLSRWRLRWLHLPLLRRWRRRRLLHLRRSWPHDVRLLWRRTTWLATWRATRRTAGCHAAFLTLTRRR